MTWNENNFFMDINSLEKLKGWLLGGEKIYEPKLVTRIHTYIIARYNPSVRIIDLVSHTTYVVCFNFIQIKKKNCYEKFLKKLATSIYVKKHYLSCITLFMLIK